MGTTTKEKGHTLPHLRTCTLRRPAFIGGSSFESLGLVLVASSLKVVQKLVNCGLISVIAFFEDEGYVFLYDLYNIKDAGWPGLNSLCHITNAIGR